jgi:toxin-antitoxin system PIN domain toxin
MILPDVNVLIYAHQTESPFHEVSREWLSRVMVGQEPVGLWDMSLTAVYRILTHPNVNGTRFEPAQILAALTQLKLAPAAVSVAPGDRYWEILSQVLIRRNVKGGLTSDAMLAALAIEHRCRIATFDKNFAIFGEVTSFTPTA